MIEKKLPFTSQNLEYLHNFTAKFVKKHKYKAN